MSEVGLWVCGFLAGYGLAHVLRSWGDKGAL
jgi:hypothetical protein